MKERRLPSNLPVSPSKAMLWTELAAEAMLRRKGNNMRSSYKIYNDQCIYFTTSTIIEAVPIFISQTYFDILIDSLNYCAGNKNLNIYAWAIMPSHFHLVCQAPELSKLMQSLKRHTAREIIHQLEADNKRWLLNLLTYYKKQHKTQSYHQVWQEGFHQQQIIDDAMLTQKIDYIHYNSVKAGFVASPEHWQNSSAAFYRDSTESKVRICPLPG
jgi:REP element-mobilizing transposase RayT